MGIYFGAPMLAKSKDWIYRDLSNLFKFMSLIEIFTWGNVVWYSNFKMSAYRVITLLFYALHCYRKIMVLLSLPYNLALFYAGSRGLDVGLFDSHVMWGARVRSRNDGLNTVEPRLCHSKWSTNIDFINSAYPFLLHKNCPARSPTNLRWAQMIVTILPSVAHCKSSALSAWDASFLVFFKEHWIIAKHWAKSSDLTDTDTIYSFLGSV